MVESTKQESWDHTLASTLWCGLTQVLLVSPVLHLTEAICIKLGENPWGMFHNHCQELTCSLCLVWH